MIRAVAVLIVFVALVSVSGWTEAQTQNILVANNSEIAFIDADNDGNRSADDCFLSAQIQTNGQGLKIIGTQESGPDELVVCSGDCYGSGFASSSFIEASITSCQYSHSPFVPMFADFCDEPSCTSTATTGDVGSPAGNTPLELQSGALFRASSGLAGSGIVCTAGGPAAQIVDDEGTTVLRNLFPLSTGGNGATHMCASNIPVQLVSGPIVFRMGCFPVAGDTSAFALSGTPGFPFAFIDFGHLIPLSLIHI